jgi:hypothetical protein
LTSRLQGFPIGQLSRRYKPSLDPPQACSSRFPKPSLVRFTPFARLAARSGLIQKSILESRDFERTLVAFGAIHTRAVGAPRLGPSHFALARGARARFADVANAIGSRLGCVVAWPVKSLMNRRAQWLRF